VEVQLCSFVTSAQDGGEWSASRSSRLIPPGKSYWYPTNMVNWTLWTMEHFFVSSGNRTKIS